MTLHLTARERDALGGADGEATALAMRVVVAAAELLGATRLVEIVSAHIDGCLHHGDGGVEFAERLVEGGARVAVPTTLNVGALDLLHPEVVRADPHKTRMARRQMEAYVAMGAQPTFTCAPYQVGHEPGLGEQVAWGESNAIAFVNSVLGARTERYGDFLDACCAITGRAPYHGLHVASNRRATVVVDLSAVPSELKDDDAFFPVLGTWLGLEVDDRIPAIVGLPVTTDRDRLKALGAAAASTGALALAHVVGVTPEAPTLQAALRIGEAEIRADGLESGSASSRAPESGVPTLRPTSTELAAARDRLSTAARAERIDAVAVGSPHASMAELAKLGELVRGRTLSVPFFACTARDTLATATERGVADILRAAGVEIVVDTCVVVTPILPAAGGVLMTNSGKFAHYGPSNTGYEVVYGSLAECVTSAETGRLERVEGSWSW